MPRANSQNIITCKNVKRGFLKALLCVYFVLTAAAAYAQPQIPAEGGAAARKAALQGESLLEAGQTEEAIKILTQAYPLAKPGEDKLQIEFLLGIAAAAAGDNRTAEWVFRRILKNNPSLIRVRLELALIYFKMRRDEQADYHFRLALSARGLPQEVQRKILLFLAQIRDRKTWDYFISFGIAPSTNINNSGAQETECFDFFGVPLCRELDKKRSAFGISGGAGVEHNLRLSPRWRLRNSLNASLADYSGSPFDIYSAGYSVGPRYTAGRLDAGLYATASKMWYGGKNFQYDYGAAAALNADVSAKISAGLAASHKRQYFTDKFDYLDGSNTGFAASLYYGLTSKSYLLLRPGVNLMDAGQDWADRVTTSLALGFGTELPWGISVYLEPGYAFSNYGGEQLVIEDMHFAMKTRRDEAFNFNIRLLQRQLNFWGFTPTLNYFYTRSASNIANLSYDKQTVEIGVTRRF